MNAESILLVRRKFIQVRIDPNETAIEPSPAPDISMPRYVRFWLLLAFEVPALISTCFVLFHLLTNRVLRSGLHNHVIIVLLFAALLTQVIDIPAYLVFATIGYVWPSTERFCQLWWFVNVGIFLITSMLVAYASVERHILVFHNNLLVTRRQCIVFHYFPLGGLLIYGFTFYIVIIFFPSCEQLFDYNQPWCSYPCYFDQKALSIYDLMGNSIFSILLTVFFSISLIVRVINRKRRMQQTVSWRKHRKMTLQLLSIVSLYLVINLPVPILIFAHLCGLPPDVGFEVQLNAYFLCYFIPLLLPYVCLASLPEIWRKLLVLYPTQHLVIQTNTLAIKADNQHLTGRIQ